MTAHPWAVEVKPVDDRAMRARLQISETNSLGHDEAVTVICECVRRLFAFVSEEQARRLASAVLAELRQDGIELVRARGEDVQ
jgi:hypothetical protein